MPPIAPRPFSQLARRCYRLGLDLPLGTIPSLTGAPWYHSGRRRPAKLHLKRIKVCRAALNEVYAAHAAAVERRTRRLLSAVYEQAKVA